MGPEGHGERSGGVEEAGMRLKLSLGPRAAGAMKP